jgi:hypothetical protein
MATIAGGRWISAAGVARILGVGKAAVPRLVERRLITVRDIPGARRKYLEDDAIRLAEESTVAAVPDGRLRSP